MRIELYAMYIMEKNRRVLKDPYGNTVSLDETLKQFNPREGDPVPVKLVIDDGRHETLRLDPWTLKQLREEGRKFIYCLPDGRKVRMLATDAAGDYPFVGQNDAKEIIRWNKFGNTESGEPEDRLVIQAEVPQEEGTAATDAAPAGETDRQADGMRNAEGTTDRRSARSLLEEIAKDGEPTPEAPGAGGQEPLEGDGETEI